MNRIKHVLVGIDFSPCSADALRQAMRIAAWSRAQVTALHVEPIPVYASPGGAFVPFEVPPMDMLLSAARERWGGWPPAKAAVGARFEAVVGIPRAELMDSARRGQADLLVVGAHGEHDARAGLGATAAACVQRARAKVLVVRRGQAAAFRSVLACIDFSETSLSALDQAIRVAAQDGAALHVLHVYRDPWHALPPPQSLTTHMPDFHERLAEAVWDHLRAFCKPFEHEAGALKAAFHAVKSERHGPSIVDFAAGNRCDLVVLGTRAKWNARDFFLGSTAERVVREAPCSVLAVKPPGFEGA